MMPPTEDLRARVRVRTERVERFRRAVARQRRLVALSRAADLTARGLAFAMVAALVLSFVAVAAKAMTPATLFLASAFLLGVLQQVAAYGHQRAARAADRAVARAMGAVNRVLSKAEEVCSGEG
jgi:hypothetical protein